MNGSRNCHAESSKWDGEGEISYDIPDMWNLKKWYKWTYQKTQTHRQWTHSCRGRGKGGGKGQIGNWGWPCTHCYLKWVTNKVLLRSTGTLLSVLWQPRWKGSLGKKGYMCVYIHICVAESLCCSPETITTLLIGYTPIQNKKFLKKKK